MKKISVLLLFTLLNAVTFGQTVDETERKPHQQQDIPLNVSLAELIANPGKYDGKKIQVTGYLHLEFEGDAIYLRKEDYQKHITKNGFWVNFSPKLTRRIKPAHYSDNYVTIIGTFNASKKGHMSMFSGTFDKIVKLDMRSVAPL
ncbi:hypothetical protein [Chitinophaga sp. CF418]|uniref:hypothetical protein n=1 Tax=Chitinophaga sp. CF418 TaxID=1855287 RepID=UPI00091817C5|nr:hypothetical protein [Chitinophaga sp. CF418]SHN37833.1 hypothetical protein SAMN05216311_110310 [Chitinophaga sp. CF418]